MTLGKDNWKHPWIGVNRWSNSHPLDRMAIAMIVVLSLVIGGIIWSGDHTFPKVREFSWQDQQIGVEDSAFILTFNRAMDWQSATENLKIQPPIPGKFSWSGRRLAYTLNQPIPYGQSFQVTLDQATAATRGDPEEAVKMQPFTGQFRSRDRTLVLLGIDGEENGRLVLHNLTQNTHQILTPATLTVLDFKADPTRNRILFTAIDRGNANQDLFEQKLYAVSLASQEAQPQYQLLLENQDYQLLDFDITPNGEVLIVQQFSRRENEPISLWVLTDAAPPRRLKHNADGQFLITPDGQTLVISQNQGVAMVSLNGDAKSKPVDFWPKFDQILNFARDGSAALMAQNNPDSTRSLYLLSNQGQEQELLKIGGYLLDAEINPSTQTVYCLYTTFNRSQTANFDLHISAIELETGKQQRLMTIPKQSSGTLSLAPDGSALLYEEVTVTDKPSQSVVLNSVGQTVSESQVWLYPLQETNAVFFKKTKPQKLLPGVQPLWLP
ncbi:Ig-like domain-containing protein [Acaryochloris sp. CCMEE 5410]|uniref:Ig-like domain-containing protein n=1 Tax=Acaryochloris sp. CCMEE 5410 TaxID=310037 RepID=UPI001F2FF096|nr:Ig-like domain-containing protein [Acaryochloris sp. CCMEE 5410]